LNSDTTEPSQLSFGFRLLSFSYRSRKRAASTTGSGCRRRDHRNQLVRMKGGQMGDVDLFERFLAA
jgi:hypothetical protein